LLRGKGSQGTTIIRTPSQIAVIYRKYNNPITLRSNQISPPRSSTSSAIISDLQATDLHSPTSPQHWCLCPAAAAAEHLTSPHHQNQELLHKSGQMNAARQMPAKAELLHKSGLPVHRTRPATPQATRQAKANAPTKLLLTHHTGECDE